MTDTEVLADALQELEAMRTAYAISIKRFGFVTQQLQALVAANAKLTKERDELSFAGAGNSVPDHQQPIAEPAEITGR